MVNILFDEWLFLDVKGQAGSYGKDEIARNYKNTFKAVSVACLDVTVKQLNIEPGMKLPKDAMIAQAFDADHLILQEWMSSDVVQLMGVSRLKIEDIYAYFKPVQVIHLVPYQAAIRAFLKSRGLLNDQRAIIFVDDLKTKAIVTVFKELMFSDARQIAMRDIGYMGEEIKRTWQNFSATLGGDQKYVLICNNREWLAEFIKLKLVTQEEILHIDRPYPVLEGLGSAIFTNNFILPKELARQKKRTMMTNWIIDLLILVSCICVSVAIYGLFCLKEQHIKSALAQSQEMAGSLKQELARAYKAKLFDHLQAQQYPQADKVYADLLRHMPSGYQVKEFFIEAVEREHFKLSALIFPVDPDYYGEFIQRGIWADADITDVTVNDQAGIKIELILKV